MGLRPSMVNSLRLSIVGINMARIGNLDELQAYQLSMDIGERIWNIVKKWDYFSKDAIGKQIVKSADSIASNLSEGYGRYSYKENKQFCYYSRGSLYETLTWLNKSYNRELITEKEYQTLKNDIDLLIVKLNKYINSIGRQKIKEYNNN